LGAIIWIAVVASPYRETESMRRRVGCNCGLAAVERADQYASGASWVSIHNGGGVGIGYSQHSGQVCVADGTKEMAKRIERVLTNDPGWVWQRHVMRVSGGDSIREKKQCKNPCFSR